MSLNKTLDRLFDEMRREAKRNPDFADRLDAVLCAHVSRRDIEERDLSSPVNGGGGSQSEPEGADVAPPLSHAARDSSPVNRGANAAAPAPSFNPVGLYQREGEDALSAALAPLDQTSLMALIAEHNLDPVGAADGLERDALACFIASQAKKRVERDKKLFDY